MAELKKTITLRDLIFYGVGVILGAGIYALIGKGAAMAGNSLWISFAIGAVIACLTALSFAELSSAMPEAAGPYVYIKKAFKLKILPFLVAWLLGIVGAATAATVAMGFSGYFNAMIGTGNILLFQGPFFEITSLTIVSLALIAIFGWIIYKSMKQSANLNTIFTLIESFGLVLIILLGILFIIFQGNPLPNMFDMPNGFSGIMSAMTLIFFAYLGFEEIVYMAEDVENPKQNVPKAVIWSIILTSIIYILVAIAAVAVVPWNQLGASEAPLADVAVAVMGNSAGLILSLIALFATANTVLIILIATSRIIYGVAKQKALPSFLTNVSEKTGTPHMAIIVTLALAGGFAIMNDIAIVAELANFGLFAVFLLVNLSLIKLRYGKEKIKPAFRSPVNIGRFPVLAGLGALACLAALVSYFVKFRNSTIILSMDISVIISLAIMGLGVSAYILLNKKVKRFAKQKSK